jgi:hypothetical protein
MILVRFAIALLFMALIVALIFRLTARLAGSTTRPPRRRRTRRPERQALEARTDQLYRKLRDGPGPMEHRDEILEFIRTRKGVEAYVEPETGMDHLSVALVADDGEWRRFELRDDSFLRQVGTELHVPIYDAGRTGYPDRMRKFKRRSLGSGRGHLDNPAPQADPPAAPPPPADPPPPPPVDPPATPSA